MARELKYHSPNTDLGALQRELAGNNKSTDDDLDDYGDYVDDEDDPASEADDAGPPWADGRR